MTTYQVPATASAINDRGEIAGFFDGYPFGSFVWRRGQLTELMLAPLEVSEVDFPNHGPTPLAKSWDRIRRR